jgi:hypothetical protein
MRKLNIVAGVTAIAILSTPVLAIGLGSIGGLAKTILGGKSVLKKAEKKCGSSLALTNGDNTTIDLAVAAVRRALPETQFLALDQTAQSAADAKAESSTFCPETKAKKKGILGSIGRAGKALFKLKKLGL